MGHIRRYSTRLPGENLELFCSVKMTVMVTVVITVIMMMQCITCCGVLSSKPNSGSLFLP